MYFQKCVVIFLVSFCQFSEGNLRFLSRFDDFCIGKEGVFCRDCRTIVECSNKALSYEMGCVDVDPSKKFCNENQPGQAICQASNTCPYETDSPAPKCRKSGRFPDPKICEVYWECPEGDGSLGTYYSCPPGTRFDPKREICIKPTLVPLTACSTYLTTAPNSLCKGKPFQTIPHPQRPDLYVKCDGSYQLEICPSNEFYDPKSNKCLFKCQKEGFFRNSDGSGFITCYRDGTRIIEYVQKCRTGSEFDEKLGYCIKKSSGENNGGNTEENGSTTTGSTPKINNEEEEELLE